MLEEFLSQLWHTMLLIFPSIEISRGCCAQVVQGHKGEEHLYSVDPVKMAILWRGENAKTLHVVDLDGVAEGKVKHREVIRQMVQAVDIPVQVGGGIRSYEEVERIFELGVYRVIIGTASVEQPELVERLVKQLGTRKIAIGIDSRNNKLLISDHKTEAPVSPLEHALQMTKLGVCRILLSVREEETDEHKLSLESLKELAQKTGIRITAWGGVKDYHDLIKLQELEKYGVDSVIIGKPLYQNTFPCQNLWRVNEEKLGDLGPTRRA
jgi:phosphoribosylformimino-5-aminoimidazole carboxamide ribotide isomerase